MSKVFFLLSQHDMQIKFEDYIVSQTNSFLLFYAVQVGSLSLLRFQDLALTATSATATRMRCARTHSSTTTTTVRRPGPSQEPTSCCRALQTPQRRSTSAGKSTRTVSSPSLSSARCVAIGVCVIANAVSKLSGNLVFR